jgi:exonuclease III
MSHSDPSNPLTADSELTIEKLKEGFCCIKESKGIKTDPRKRFLQDLRDFLLDLNTDGHLYIVGWDANDAHSSDDVATLLEEANMADAFTDFFDERPPTHNRGALQIDQISMSPSLLQYVNNAFILDPTHGEGDHSYIGIDFDIASLVNRRSIRDVDPGNNQNRLLVSTDVKPRIKYLDVLKKK